MPAGRAPRSAELSHRRPCLLKALSGFGVSALMLALLLLPLMLGGNRFWAVGLVAGLLWLGIAAWAAATLAAPGASLQAWRQRRAQLGWAPAWPLAMLVLLAALAAAQLLFNTLGLAGPGLPSTIDAFQTRDHLLRTLLYGGGFALVLAVAHDEQRVRWVLLALLVSGVVQAFLAALLLASTSSYTIFHTSFSPSSRASGTFPNPDHLAGFIELCLAAGLGLMFSQFEGASQAAANWKQRALGALQFMLSPKMVLRLLLIVLVVALVLTRSRMGNGAFFISLLLIGLVVAWRSVKLRRPALWLVASMVVVDIFVIGQLVGIEKVITRLHGTDMSLPNVAAAGGPGAEEADLPSRAYTEESLEQRLTAPLTALALVASRPAWGHGGGSFESAFPAVRTAEVIPYQFNHAHNDYVQQAAEMGLVGLALWLGIAGLAGWRALKLLGDKQSALSRGVGVSTLVALSCIGLHSLVDFNLQIPANALSFTVLLALPFAMPLRAERGVSKDLPKPIGGPGAAWALRIGALVIVVVGAWVYWQAGRTFLADLSVAPTKDLLIKQDSSLGSMTVETFETARGRLEEALELTPDSPLLHARLGVLRLAAGAAAFTLKMPDGEALARAHRQNALGHFQEATRLRPQDPTMWVGLANAHQALGQQDKMWQAWRRARAVGPFDPGVQALGLDAALPSWPNAPKDVQEWAIAVFEKASPEERALINEEAREFGWEFVDE